MTQERHNWLVDGSHTSNVYGSVRISGSGMAAREATEMGLIGPVAFIAKTTDCAGTGCVARVNIDYAHARKLCFVADKRSELPKSPGVARTTLLASNRSSFSNALQVFERECLTLRACLRNQRLADAVIYIFLKAVFAPSVLAQSPAGAARVCQLQAAAMLEPTIPKKPDIRAAVCLAIRVGGQIHDAQVNAQIAGRFIRGGRGLRLGDAQIPHIVAPDQFCAADLPRRIIQVSALEIAQDKLPDHAPAGGVERYTIQAEKAVGTRVVADAAIACEGWAGRVPVRARRPYRFRRLVPGTTGQLCAQAIVDAGRAIDDVMELVLVRDTLLPGNRGAITRGRIKRGLGLTQRGISRRINSEFTANGSCGECYCHRDNILQIERLCSRRLMYSNVVPMRRYSFP
jgi:hypothetical protein